MSEDNGDYEISQKYGQRALEIFDRAMSGSSLPSDPPIGGSGYETPHSPSKTKLDQVVNHAHEIVLDWIKQ